MIIKYYRKGKNEILSITDNNGKVIKQGSYTFGNCLIDILIDDEVVQINPHVKSQIIDLIDKCDNYLGNNICELIEKQYEFTFKNEYTFKNELIENSLVSVYYITDIYVFVCYLVSLIYKEKIMYKRCDICGKYFATRYSHAKYCNRIITKSGRTCRQVGLSFIKEQTKTENS